MQPLVEENTMKNVNIDQLVADELLRLHVEASTKGTSMGALMAIPMGYFFVYPYTSLANFIFWYLIILLSTITLKLIHYKLKTFSIQ